jgi:site-specific recombinase XerD
MTEQITPLRQRMLDDMALRSMAPATQRAYVRAVSEFCAWLEAHGVPSIAAVGSIHVAAYVEGLSHRQSAATVKQHLAASQCVPGSAGIVGARQAKGPSRNSEVSAQPRAP